MSDGLDQAIEEAIQWVKCIAVVITGLFLLILCSLITIGFSALVFIKIASQL